MLGIIDGLIKLATVSLGLISQKEARKYIDQMLELRLAIQKEESRGYDSDDAKIEAMYKEFAAVADAMSNDLMHHGGSSVPAQPAITPTA